ncbi:MAG TPA: hypothetical protein VND65_06170, partial [Candidatus Binatia bacterium]|nr:hypothetical protein [Candidatus Binatia bacterium]
MIAARGFDIVAGSTNCFTATISCPNTDQFQLDYAVTPPQGGAPLIGSIVMLTGDGGTYASNIAFSNYYVPYYESQGYQVVEVAWGPDPTGTAWEIANSGLNSTKKANILYAACRPATFLHYVKTGGTIWSSGGMCVHADSGGAGAVAYSLTWYNLAADLDRVLAENGPVFSDINQGCTVTCQNNYCADYSYTTVCLPGSTQTGCSNWSSPPDGIAEYNLEYSSSDAPSVDQWSGNSALNPGKACANSSTPTQYAEQWANMSIVAGQVSGY